MQFIAAITALFAGAALAAPQWGPPPPVRPASFDPYGPYPPPCYPYCPGPPPNPWDFPPPPPPGVRPGQGGNGEGRYHGGCSCSVAGNLNADIGRLACDKLHQSYNNLNWDYFNGACIDDFGAGVEQNGYTRACQEVAAQFFPTAFGFDFTNFVWGECTVR